MARNNPLHIDIPCVPSHLHNKMSTNHGGPHSPGGMFTTMTEEGGDESFFSLTRNGSQYPDSPSSDISSPMMTPLPFKMMMPQPNTNNMSHLLTPVTPGIGGGVEKEDRKKLREYEFPSPTAMASSVTMKVEASAYQAYQNHPFTQFRQQRQQLQQQQQLPSPPTAKATPNLSYSAKYANYTNNSSTTATTTTAIITPQQQTVVRVSPRPAHFNKDSNTRKPSTTMALSMIEKEKMAYQYPPSHRVSMVSPPPPPYISSSPPSDHGAGVGTPPATATTTQSAASTAAAVIAIAPPLQVPDQQHHHHLHYDPTVTTTGASSSLAAKSKRHSLPVALARSVSSSSFSTSSSPAIIVAGSGVMVSDSGVAATPRVFSPRAPSRDVKRHSLAVIPSSASSTMFPSNNNMARPNKIYGHRSISNMPPQAIPIYASTGSAADMMMKTPPTTFNPRAPFSSSSSPSTRLLERNVNAADIETVFYNLKHHHHHHHVHSPTVEEGADKDLSALIGPEHDHKNNLLTLSHTNINAHNLHTSSSSPLASSPARMQGLLRIASLQRATAAASAAERNLILSTSRIGGGPTSMSMGLLERSEFPGFWEDAKQHNMHWTVYTMGLAALASLVWVLILPSLMMFVPIFPGAVVLLMGLQYSVYRWRRRRHYIQQLKDRRPSPAALSSMRAASAALTGTTSLTHSRSSSAVATAPSSPQFHAFSPNHHHLSHVRGISGGGGGGTGVVGLSGLGHAYRSSLSSMHTSVGSITTSDSFLEPHQPSGSSSVRDSPPHHLKAQLQHQYYRQPGNGSVTGSSATGSPPRFSEVYGADVMNSSPSPPTTSSARQAQAGNHYQTPSPEYRRSWFSAFRTPVNNNGGDTKNSNSNSNSGRWERTIQRRESSSSIASSETVSSSSTASACDLNDSRKCPPTAACTSSCVSIPGSHSSDTGSFSSIPMTSSVHSGGEKKKCPSGDLSTIMVMAPPPPAYVSQRCEDVVSSLELMGGSGGGGVNEKQGLHHSLQEKVVVAVLPEIAPFGDLMSEFAVDFGAIRY